MKTSELFVRCLENEGFEYILTEKAGRCRSTLGPVGLRVKDLVSFGHPYKKARTT